MPPSLRVPSLGLGDLGLWQEQMHVFIADLHRLVLAFRNFDAQTVWRLDIGLINPAVATGHGNAICLPLGHLLLDVIEDKANVVDHRASRSTIPRRISLASD